MSDVTHLPYWLLLLAGLVASAVGALLARLYPLVKRWKPLLEYSFLMGTIYGLIIVSIIGALTPNLYVVVLVGFGISRVDLSGMSADSSDAGGSSDTAAGESAAEPAAPSPLDGDAEMDGQGLASLGPVVRLSSDRLEQQVRRLVEDAAAGRDEVRSVDEAGDCRVPSGPGRSLAATYDGAAAVLVLRPPTGGVRVADVYLCGQRTPVRSVSVPVG